MQAHDSLMRGRAGRAALRQMTRRGFAGAALGGLAALGASVVSSRAALADEAGSSASMDALSSGADALAGSDASGAGGAAGQGASGSGVVGGTDAVTALNEVTYPQPVDSGDYYDYIQALDVDSWGEELFSVIATFADNLTCYGIGQGIGSQDDAAGATGLASPVNQCLSPVSAYLALALLAQGARGETQAQLFDVLGVGASDVDGAASASSANDAAEGSALSAANFAGTCSRLIQLLWAQNTPEEDSCPGILQVANSVWARADVPIEQTFLDVATKDFTAECYRVDEVGPAAGAVMGEWIGEHTGGNLSPQIQLDAQWITSIINTVWFKAGWSDAFDEANTAPDVFHAASGDVECDFMSRIRTCSVVRGQGYRLASLPLATGASLLLMLPDEGTDPRAFLGRASGISRLWGQIGTSSELVEATFYVPKVSFSRTVQLADVLKQMGVTLVFGASEADGTDANLSGISEAASHVSAVEQGMRFSMNEQGVEASAYTMVAIAMAALPQDLEQVELRFDHPFAFRLVNRNGIVLFDGVVDDPTAE